MNIEKIIQSVPFKTLILALFNNNENEILERPGSYIVRLKKENPEKIFRIIILPPKGFTANKKDEMSPHPEARQAKITVKGAIRSKKSGFSILKNVIDYKYYTRRDIEISDDSPYAPINNNDPFYREELKSSKDQFLVVSENGEGFYHSLINLSDEWIVLILEKDLKTQKKINIKSKIRNLENNKQKIILGFITQTKRLGDKIFKIDKKLIDQTTDLEVDETLPALIEALNIHETGKHEPCTIYAVILKIGKKNPKKTQTFLKNALKNNEAPRYYLRELIQKISKS
jgi:hypothetical protein